MQNLEAVLKSAMEAVGVAGAQLSVIKGDERVDLAVGLRDTELGKPMTVDTTNQIGSVTKVFNAAMVLELVARDELDLDEPVIKRIPEFKLQDQDAASKITLRHLLSMSAGIDNGDYTYYDTIAQRIESLANCPQHFASGEGYGYSNAATDITGYVAQRVMGRPWDDLLQEFVLDPVKLTYSATRDARRDLGLMSRGHFFNPADKSHSFVEVEQISLGSAPAGSTLTSNAADLASLGKALLDGYLDPGGSVFAGSTIQAMFTPQVEVPLKSLATAWCLGPAKAEWQDVPIWWHPGGNACGSSWLMILPEQRAVFACTSNTPSVVLDFNIRVMNELLPAAFGVTPTAPTVDKRPLAEIDRYVGTYGALGGEIIVERRGDRLFGTHRMSWGDVHNIAGSGFLEPIGPGVFWFNDKDEARPSTTPNEIAFSGSDDQGRATYLVNMFISYGRAHGERIAAQRSAQAADMAPST